MSVRCRGTCKAGHTTEADAEAGRVTWHGTCATEGCEHKVYCRRVPADTPAPPPDTRTAESDPHRVLEVPGYRDEPPPAGDDGDDDGSPAGDQQPDEPAAADDRTPAPAAPRHQQRRQRRPRSAGAPAPPVTPTPPRPEQPRGLVGRFRARLGEPVADEDDDRLFGVY